ncbi:MAG: nicotinamidase/pyrazinamidase [Flavobacteriales bacterium]|jgi:nicotinamidase/pyrazinamidase
MRALLLVDIQNDFLPGGALAVTDGDAVVPVANALMPGYPLVVATQDWHPAGHESFASAHEGRAPGELIDLHGLPQVLWPDHCVQQRPGASFASGLHVAPIAHVTRKGTHTNVDSYSGFFDNGKRHATDLHDFLQREGVTDLDIVGLATDYCVRFTAVDAAQLGYGTRLHLRGVRGVELAKGDCADAIEAMRHAGVEIVG